MRIGILGGGQLAQMLVIAGIPLKIDFLCFAPEAGCPASRVSKIMCGDYRDPQAMRQFNDAVDLMTFESENIPIDSLQPITKPIFPSCKALEVSQDRWLEKNFFKDLHIPTTEFIKINQIEDLNVAIEQLGLPLLLKTRRHGYDGKGQALIRHKEEAVAAFQALSSNQLIAEKWLLFDMEVSLIGVRNAQGEVFFYPLTKNIHQEGILRISKAPFFNAELLKKAQSYLRTIMEQLNYIGVLAVEFFVQDQVLIANEMAPRVHNSGHWTIEGAKTSQFENHLRAILNLPLGATEAIGYSAMINLIGNIPPLNGLLKIPSLHVHLYGKSPRPLRKLGHVTLCADSEEILEDALNSTLLKKSSVQL